MIKNKSGFTIVELLIVIVVIGILAAISMVAYSGVQQRARDSTRKQDLAAIAKAVNLYHADNGQYPPTQVGWCTQVSNPVYPQFKDALSRYISKIPQDPIQAGEPKDYFYRNYGSSFVLYAQVEGSGNGSYSSAGCSVIGGGTVSYNYAYGK